MIVTTLCSHRLTEPYGLAGGQAGERGRDTVERVDGGH